jgi:hypothetical protein
MRRGAAAGHRPCNRLLQSAIASFATRYCNPLLQSAIASFATRYCNPLLQSTIASFATRCCNPLLQPPLAIRYCNPFDASGFRCWLSPTRGSLRLLRHCSPFRARRVDSGPLAAGPSRPGRVSAWPANVQPGLQLPSCDSDLWRRVEISVSTGASLRARAQNAPPQAEHDARRSAPRGQPEWRMCMTAEPE